MLDLKTMSDLEKASIESHSATYTAAMKNWVYNFVNEFNLIESDPSNSTKYVANIMTTIRNAQPVLTQEAAANRVSTMMSLAKTGNSSGFIDYMDSTFVALWPYKTVSAGKSTTTTIELKTTANGVGPGTKRFTRMEEMDANTGIVKPNSEYAWWIDDIEVSKSAYDTMYNKWVAAAVATATVGGVIENKVEDVVETVENKVEDVVETVENKVEDVVETVENVAEDVKAAIPNPNDMFGGMMQSMIANLILPLVGFVAFGAVVILLGVGAFFLYKKFIAPKLAEKLPDAYTQLSESSPALGMARATYEGKPLMTYTMQGVGKGFGQIEQQVQPVMQVAAEHPEATQAAIVGGSMAAGIPPQASAPIAGAVVQQSTQAGAPKADPATATQALEIAKLAGGV